MRGPPGVVAVEAEAPVEIQFRTGPGTENQAEFGAEDRLGGIARVGGRIAVDVKDEHIPSQTKDAAYLGMPWRLVLIIEAHTCFMDLIIAGGADAVAPQRLQQGHLGNRVVADLQADGMIHRSPERGGGPRLGHFPPGDDPSIRLLELIAIVGIIEEKGEVRKQAQAVIRHIGIGLGESNVALVGPLPVQAIACGASTIGRIDRAQAGNQALIDGPLRDLIRRVPGVRVGGKAERKVRGPTPERILEEAVKFLDVLVVIPGAIIKIRLKGIEQRAWANLRGVGDEDAIIVVLAYPDFGEPFWQRLEEVKRGGAGGGKISDIGIVGPLPEVDIVNEFGNNPIQVHIALAVGMRGEIDRDTVDKTGEIRAMVEIETAQKVLIGFPSATVLCHDHARHDFQDFSRAEHRPGFELDLADTPLRGRTSNPREIIGAAGNHDRFQDHGEISRERLLGRRGEGLGPWRARSPEAEHEATAQHHYTIPDIVHTGLLYYYEWKILHTGKAVNLS